MRIKDGKAVKTFKKAKHLLQEWLAGRYLREALHVVKPFSFNLRTREMSMELYDMTLHDWMFSKRGMTELDKKIVFRELLKALVEIHERGLVHGDIKPNNVLVNRHPIRVVIGDLGFVSLETFAKVERTATSYRDTVISNSYAHDIFSLGILALELFGDSKIVRQAGYEELQQACVTYVKEPVMRSIILAMLNENHISRPSSSEILHLLYGITIPVGLKVSPLFDVPLDSHLSIKRWMKTIASLYDIKRPKRGYRILCMVFRRGELSPSDMMFYAATMLMVLSTMFGRSGFAEMQVLYNCGVDGVDISDVHSVLEYFMNDEEIIDALLLP